MPRIELKEITKKFGDFTAVDGLSLTIEDGDFITLLGPSGCGKTTTLRQIAGLETPTSGEISIDGKVVYSSKQFIDVPPAERGVGFLFQNYALWPHMTVYQNIAFGLENMKWSKADIDKRVKELLKLLRIEEFPERYPAELSGGQQQRVAIARTLATNPRVLLMDEPLSNLDAKLRMEMRTELKRLHHETGATFVYVTHDQLEAMTLSTKICLLKNGKLQQYAPPLDIYRHPVNVFAADFIGSPSINLAKAVVVGKKENSLQLQMLGTQLTFETENDLSSMNDTDVTVGIRPEQISVGEGPHCAHVQASLPSGMETIVQLVMKDQSLNCVMFGDVDYKVGSDLPLSFISNRITLFDNKGLMVAVGKLV